jgi:hypothetical protein
MIWSRPLLQDYPSKSYSAEGNWDGCIEDDETKKIIIIIIIRPTLTSTHMSP